jgi:hypothetical protein
MCAVLHTLNANAAPMIHITHAAKMRLYELRRMLRLMPDHDVSCQSSAIESGMYKRLLRTAAGPSSPQQSGAVPAGSGIPTIAALHDCRHPSAGMVRIIVNLRPEQYDELFRHVREVGSTMSAFCRESVVNALREEHPNAAPRKN